METNTFVVQADALAALEKKVQEAEERLKKLKAQFFVAAKAAADTFRMNGIDELVTSQGVKYKVTTVTQCSIGRDNKKAVAKWLDEHGASHLVKEQCIVPASQKEALAQAQITYEDVVDCNTNSVKAFLLGALGQKESPATITLDDIPQGISWFQYDTVERIG